MKNQFLRRRGGGSVLKNQIEGEEGWGGSELSDQLLDPDVPTLASQDKLKVSPKGLPFVISRRELILEGGRGGGVCIEKSIPRGRGGGLY